MGFSGTPNNGTPENGKRDPYYSHTTPIKIPKDMGIVWEAYHKGVPLLVVSRISLDTWEHPKVDSNTPRLLAQHMIHNDAKEVFMMNQGKSQIELYHPSGMTLT